MGSACWLVWVGMCPPCSCALPCPHSTGLQRAQHAKALPLGLTLVLLLEIKRTWHKRKPLFAFFPPHTAFKSNSRNMKKRQCQPLVRDRNKALFGSHSPILPLPFPCTPASTLFLLRRFILGLQGERNEKLLFEVVFACEFPTLG